MSKMIELNNNTLERCSSALKAPTYPRVFDRYIAHIGVGGFHRSHQAYYLDQLLRIQQANQPSQHTERWGVIGIGMREQDSILDKALHVQNGLYSLILKDDLETDTTIIGSIECHLMLGNYRKQILNILAAETTGIIGLTITEKGYNQNTEGQLDWNSEQIQHDANNPDNPISAIGLIALAIKERALHQRPVTVLSSDNLPSNGDFTKSLVTEYVARIYPEAQVFLTNHVCFPNAMVDRITPAPNDGNQSYLLNHYGLEDRCPIAAESFGQWVIEESFASGRPQLELVGSDILFVDSAIPYEQMKIRLLNGGHSALAYAALLEGETLVDEAMQKPLIKQFLCQYFNEVKQTIDSVPGINLDEYCDTLIKRFSNVNVRDNIRRLAMEGSQKLPNTMKEPIRILLEKQLPCDHMSRSIVNYIACLSSTDPAHAFEEPGYEQLAPLARKAMASGDATQFIEALFGEQFNHDTQGEFSATVSNQLVAFS